MCVCWFFLHIVLPSLYHVIIAVQHATQESIWASVTNGMLILVCSAIFVLKDLLRENQTGLTQTLDMPS